MKRPRLSYNVAVYHRDRSAQRRPMTARTAEARRDDAARPIAARAARRPLAAVRPRRSPRRDPASRSSVALRRLRVTVRDASQIPLLAAGGVVLGIVFIALAAYCAARDLAGRASTAGTGGRSRSAIGGGLAAIIGAGCLAGAIILFLLSPAGRADRGRTLW